MQSLRLQGSPMIQIARLNSRYAVSWQDQSYEDFSDGGGLDRIWPARYIGFRCTI